MVNILNNHHAIYLVLLLYNLFIIVSAKLRIAGKVIAFSNQGLI